ncbi:MAG: hypothetical protein AAGJ93_02985, partial [Bacteroidota bacterium]
QGPPPTSRQTAEYHILKDIFDINTAHYLSLPLVLFGEVEGIMHFVYSDKDHKRINTRSIGSMIRSSSAMLETQILEWDLVGRNPEKAKAIMQPLEESFYESVNSNPFLRQLGFREYYRKFLGFYQRRIRFNDDVIHSKVYRPYLKAAITAIMIDSFAHNVSAHSLVALNWWFKQRAENLRSVQRIHQDEVEELNELVDNNLEEGYDRDRIYELLRPWITGLFVRNADPDYDLVNFSGPLAREIQPLLKFLMQKGAFWSGISRDNHFGGESATAFDVLWNDFINNPLYLGTIAKSEDIHRIRFRVIVYEPAVQASQKKTGPLTHKKPLIDGIFVEVDLKKMRPPITTKSNGIRGFEVGDEFLGLDQFPELEDMSDFVSPGKDYGVVKAALEECGLFFPGEVVGRHAFFTLIENKIRNVKHFKGEPLKRMQQDGMELCISFQERPVRLDMQNENSLYSIGIWLSEVAQLWINDKHLILQSRFENLSKAIMDEDTFAPRLGGSSQDKLCASMLFNNYFSKVQNGDDYQQRDLSTDTLRDAAFYPWIIPASSPEGNMYSDLEMHPQQVTNSKTLDHYFPTGKGYLKKFFHIWKAADIQQINEVEEVDFVWDNLARFKFVLLQAKNKDQVPVFEKIRAKGVMRVIQQEIDNKLSGEEAIYAAYQHWLRSWIGNTPMSIRLITDNAIIGQFTYQPQQSECIKYVPVWDLAEADSNNAIVSQDLHIAHGGDTNNIQLLRYRNHGIYANYFRSELVPNQALSAKAKARMAEFFEVLATRICIFDSRVFHRVGNAERRATLAKQLLLHVYDESNQAGAPQNNDWLGHWESQKEWIIKQSHFLVLHLSFIEKILITKYSDHPDYGDENLGLFIQQEIMPLAQDENGEVRDNFVLVITTGRGRTKWWTRLAEEESYHQYRQFTNFRPVESIISAIEDAINRRDDIEVKYNLVKVMFGS